MIKMKFIIALFVFIFSYSLAYALIKPVKTTKDSVTPIAKLKIDEEAAAEEIDEEPDKTVISHIPTASAMQLVLVTADNWSSNSGVLQRYERSNVNEEWVAVGKKINVILGQRGMGWGSGLHGDPVQDPNHFDGPVITTEGLKRSPVGVFKIPEAFGKDPIQNLGVKLPYTKITETIYCSGDKNYNKIVDSKIAMAEDWKKGESMYHYVYGSGNKDDDDAGVYNVGAVIGHNLEGYYGRGSCFFLEVKRKSKSPTAGGTAMEEQDAKEVINWLDPKKNPMLVQLPKTIYAEYESVWGLPDTETENNYALYKYGHNIY
jgi:zinc D-Ala-D-Ala dipeptidase